MSWSNSSAAIASSSVTRRTWAASSDPRHAWSAVSTHNPLGTTFAAGVYTSIFGSLTRAD